MHTLYVCLPPGHRAWVGSATELSEIVQSVLETFCVHSKCGLFQRQVHISSFDS